MANLDAEKISRIVHPPTIEEYPYTDLDFFLAPVEPNMLVKCGHRVWSCHKEILCPRCSFFEICCYSGFEESDTSKIRLVDDNPNAVDAMLRYLYTLDFRQIFPEGQHMFEDVEFDLDIFLVADKYEVLLLRNHMESKITIFYEMLQRPQNTTKTWDDQSRLAFSRVLRKLYTLVQDTTVETGRIRKSVVQFIIAHEKRVMQWQEVTAVMDEYVDLSNDIIRALFLCRRDLYAECQTLREEVSDLREVVEQLQDENEELAGEFETTWSLADAENRAYCVDEIGDYEFGGPAYDAQYRYASSYGYLPT